MPKQHCCWTNSTRFVGAFEKMGPPKNTRRNGSEIMMAAKHAGILCCALALFALVAKAETEAAAWPSPIPCRVADGTNKDLWVMTLGAVQTPLADGVFDPRSD